MEYKWELEKIDEVCDETEYIVKQSVSCLIQIIQQLKTELENYKNKDNIK
jgi:hypothetical protein